MNDGQKLILEMRKDQDIKFWSTPDLIRYLHKIDRDRGIVLTDPQENEKCFNLCGDFTIAEIEAMLICQLNDRGSMRG